MWLKFDLTHEEQNNIWKNILWKVEHNQPIKLEIANFLKTFELCCSENMSGFRLFLFDIPISSTIPYCYEISIVAKMYAYDYNKM
jgi:hypothetical protein